MNSRQRRKKARSRGERPPYTCLWCDTEMAGLQDPCACKEDPRPRTRLLDYKLRKLGEEALKRGFRVNWDLTMFSPEEQLVNLTEKKGRFTITVERRE